MPSTRLRKRRTALIAAAVTFTVIGIVLLLSLFPGSTGVQSIADDVQLAALMPQLKQTPVHTVDATFDPSRLQAYIASLLDMAEQAGLSARSAQTSPDLNDIEVELWGRGILVVSLYRLENSPKNYSIFIYAKDDRSSLATADIILTKVTETLASVAGIKLTVGK